MCYNFLGRELSQDNDHSNYSPDLALSDFGLFAYIECRLSDQPDVQSLFKVITKIVENIPQSEFLKTFQKWKERMELCITYNSEYFEHLIK